MMTQERCSGVPTFSGGARNRKDSSGGTHQSSQVEKKNISVRLSEQLEQRLMQRQRSDNGGEPSENSILTPPSGTCLRIAPQYSAEQGEAPVSMHSSLVNQNSMPNKTTGEQATIASRDCKLLLEFGSFLSRKIDESKQVIRILSKEELEKKEHLD